MDLQSLLMKLMPLTGSYYAGRDLSEFISFVNHWIMFPHKDVQNKKQGESAPFPNVYVHHVASEGPAASGGPFTIGITYNNYGALEWITSINEMGNEEAKQKLEGLIQNLSDKYHWAIDTRTRRAKTEFDPFKEGLTRDCNFEEIVKDLAGLTAICKTKAGTQDEKGKISWVAPSFNLAYVSVDTFSECELVFKELFEILLQLFGVKTLSVIQETQNLRETLQKELETYKRLLRVRGQTDRKSVV